MRDWSELTLHKQDMVATYLFGSGTSSELEQLGVLASRRRLHANDVTELLRRVVTSAKMSAKLKRGLMQTHFKVGSKRSQRSALRQLANNDLGGAIVKPE